METENYSEISSFNSFTTLSSRYSTSITRFLIGRISSNVVTPNCASRTLRVLGGGEHNGCLVVGVSTGCAPRPVRAGRIFNVGFRRGEGSSGVAVSLFGSVPAGVGRVPRVTGVSLLVSVVALGCARSGSIYCTVNNRAVNINTNRRSEVRYAHLTNGGTSGF